MVVWGGADQRDVFLELVYFYDPVKKWSRRTDHKLKQKYVWT